MNLEPILKKYDKGGGASRFHPVMMFKVLVYGYMTRTYSSRMLAKALRENVMYMWLSGNQTPDFRTINTFRGSRLKDIMEEVFMATVKMLAAKGYVKLEYYFVDGTKIESAANKYSFVWKRGIDANERIAALEQEGKPREDKKKKLKKQARLVEKDLLVRKKKYER